jgi:hypothetical protein
MATNHVFGEGWVMMGSPSGSLMGDGGGRAEGGGGGGVLFKMRGVMQPVQRNWNRGHIKGCCLSERWQMSDKSAN